MQTSKIDAGIPLNGIYASMADAEWEQLSKNQKQALTILDEPDYTALWDDAYVAAYLDSVNEYLDDEKAKKPKRKGYGRPRFCKAYFSDVDEKTFDRWFTEYNPIRGLFDRFKRIPELRDVKPTAAHVVIAFDRAAVRWVRNEILRLPGKRKKWLTCGEYFVLQRIHEDGREVPEWYADLDQADQRESLGTFVALMADWGSAYRIFVKAAWNAD